MNIFEDYIIIIYLNDVSFDNFKSSTKSNQEEPYFKFRERVFVCNSDYFEVVQKEKHNAIVLYHKQKNGSPIEVENRSEWTIYKIFYTSNDTELREILKIINEYLQENDKKLSEEEFCYKIYNFLRHNIKGTILAEIITKLSPLVIAMQAYCAVDVDNKRWYYWGKDNRPEWLHKEIKIEKAPEQWEQYPYKNAFMLVEEAQWDYYALLFNMMLSNSKNGGVDNTYKESSLEEKESYDEDNKLYALLKKFIMHTEHDIAIENLIRSFSLEDASTNKDYFILNLNGKNYRITFSDFVKKIRELTAIFANTVKKTKGSYVFCYKGRNCDYRDKILSELFTVATKELNSMRHSKLVSQPKHYNKLTEQLDTWLKADKGINYFIVYEGLAIMINRLRAYSND